jgi:hypothetical protein
MHIIVPVELRAVIEGLRDAARKGSAPAARELREYMERFPLQRGGQEAAQAKRLEDMTPEELDFGETYLLHRVARAERRATGLKAAAERVEAERLAQAEDEGLNESHLRGLRLWRRSGYSAAVVLFPIAFLWLLFVVLWAVRQTVEPSDGPCRPWRKRTPGRRDGPHGHPFRGGTVARSASRSKAARESARR